jgi:hypothetical protein
VLSRVISEKLLDLFFFIDHDLPFISVMITRAEPVNHGLYFIVSICGSPEVIAENNIGVGNALGDRLHEIPIEENEGAEIESHSLGQTHVEEEVEEFLDAFLPLFIDRIMELTESGVLVSQIIF